jgi:aspartate/methionine/tyrosine aminotransferase
VYDEATIRELVAIAEVRDALLVSDEVYARFDHSDRFASAAGIDSDHRIVTGSFSKSLAITGFRVGYAILPDAHFAAARSRHMLTDVTGSRPVQYAVARALAETPKAYYAANREVIGERVAAFASSRRPAWRVCPARASAAGWTTGSGSRSSPPGSRRRPNASPRSSASTAPSRQRGGGPSEPRYGALDRPAL